MVDSINTTQPLPKFTTVKYTAKDGENITATKQDGIVTLSGDKNGVRQMPLEDFIKKELVENVQNVKLEKSPDTDLVELSSNLSKDENKVPAQINDIKDEPIVGKNLDVAV